MKTTTRFLFTAIVALAMALTISACSSDGNSTTTATYGSCSDMMNASMECYYEVMQSDSFLTYQNCIIACNDDETCEDACDAIIDPIMEQCIVKSGICGGASFQECENHFLLTCDWDDGEAPIPSSSFGISIKPH